MDSCDVSFSCLSSYDDWTCHGRDPVRHAHWTVTVSVSNDVVYYARCLLQLYFDELERRLLSLSDRFDERL